MFQVIGSVYRINLMGWVVPNDLESIDCSNAPEAWKISQPEAKHFFRLTVDFEKAGLSLVAYVGRIHVVMHLVARVRAQMINFCPC